MGINNSKTPGKPKRLLNELYYANLRTIWRVGRSEFTSAFETLHSFNLINSFFLWRLLKMGNLPLASKIYQTVGLKLVGLHVCILLYSFIDLNALNDA